MNLLLQQMGCRVVPGKFTCAQGKGEVVTKTWYAQVEAQAGHRDAESRAAAVRALSTVAYELFPVRPSLEASSGSAGTLPYAAAVMESYVICPLLQGAQDYSTDDRCCPLRPSQYVLCRAHVL